jgi:hypothetical protein
MNIMIRTLLFASVLGVLSLVSTADARDFFLTIGGGHSRESDQASLEKNVLFYQLLLKEQNIPAAQQSVYFAAGATGGKDVQAKDVDSLPKANRLMAEFFGTERDLGLHYRTIEVPGVLGATTRENIQNWFAGVGKTLTAGDRLIIYVTAHGEKSEDRKNSYETSIMLWNDEKLTVSEFVALLDSLPDGVSVVAVMVQCYTGGFARFIYDKADPEKGLAKQNRCGFFATVHDRVAAGCTPDVDETTYVEYSTYFWEALAGHTRAGGAVVRPDYDGDGTVSFAEAHAYTVLNADTIDLPLTSSSEFLNVESKFQDDDHPKLLPKDAPYETIHELATPAERAVLDGLSKQLNLTGEERIAAAQRESRLFRRGRSRGREQSPRRRAAQLRATIADDLEKRWPELANVLNPGAVELVTTRSKEFVDAVEQHPKYTVYGEQKDLAAHEPDPQKRRAKFERFIRAAQDVIRRENLKRLDDQKLLTQYQAIAVAEATSLHNGGASLTKRPTGSHD